DKGTNGSGHTRANQINSTREAAARALLKSGPKGEALLKEKGLPILREGLTDPSPAVREHSAYTIGQLGPMSQALAPDVQKLCTDPDANVRAAAFDALRLTGIADPVALAKLMTHEDEETARLAGELVSTLTALPKGAAEPLGAALKSSNPNIQRAAGDALALMGPDAAPAVPALVALLKAAYKDRDPANPRAEEFGPEISAWGALGRIGEPAVAPTAKLLDEPDPLFRYYALRTLGDLGPVAKPAAASVKKVLQDQIADNALEAACTLLRMGESTDDALALLKRALDSDARGIAALGIQAIGRAGPPAATLVPEALSKLTNPDTFARNAALELIATLPLATGTKHAEEIGRLATDEERVIRNQAARVLVRFGPAGAPAADALGKALPNEKDPGVRDQFVNALLAMGVGAKPALPALLSVIEDTNFPLQLRLNVVAALVVVDPSSPEVTAGLVKATQNAETAIRAAAATAMSQLNPLSAGALSTLMKMAKGDSRNGARVAALRALAVAGTKAKPVRAELEAMTTHPQAGLAFWAKVALAAVDGDVSKAGPVVRAGLSDRNPAVRASASEAILVTGPTKADLPALLNLLKEPGPAARAAGAAALGKLGADAKDAVPQLARLLDDPDSEVRIPAAEALGRIGPAALPAVRKLKELLRDPLVWPTAQTALAKIETK
ncbi:MAG TPA: HEAT repeat domain-containing protein, partial [Gemmata sp.]